MVRNIVRKAAILVPVLAGLTLGAAGTATARDHTCLWKITGDHNAVYLLGSIHMLPPDAWPLPNPMQRAFDHAKRVVFEADLGDTVGAGMLMLQRAALPRGTTLSTLLPPELHRRFVAALAKVDGDPETLEGVKPWFASMTLASLELQAAGYQASEGIDLRLWSEAIEAGKKTGGLETLAHQIEILDSFTMQEQIELLRQTLDELDQVAPQLGTMTQLWRTGQADALAKMLISTFKDAPKAYQKLVVERNQAWLPHIEAMTHEDGDVLVVVGVLHLVGPSGLVEALRSHGLLVIQQ
ncbi:MAG: TraB/GumN family protein [Acidobacteria bacterium]|nr:TraB/GumN family protein [Acidobacteriota bacterium]